MRSWFAAICGPYPGPSAALPARVVQAGRTANAALPTDDRLLRFTNGDDDPALVTLFYQYGRYLLISSSNAKNLLPSNSQGLWGDGLKMPWFCDYKSNINFQMNYWPAEIANLSECHEPMLRFIQTLVEPGRKTAKAYFDAPGWMMAFHDHAVGLHTAGLHRTMGAVLQRRSLDVPASMGALRFYARQASTSAACTQ